MTASLENSETLGEIGESENRGRSISGTPKFETLGEIGESENWGRSISGTHENGNHTKRGVGGLSQNPRFYTT